MNVITKMVSILDRTSSVLILEFHYMQQNAHKLTLNIYEGPTADMGQ